MNAWRSSSAAQTRTRQRSSPARASNGAPGLVSRLLGAALAAELAVGGAGFLVARLEVRQLVLVRVLLGLFIRVRQDLAQCRLEVVRGNRVDGADLVGEVVHARLAGVVGGVRHNGLDPLAGLSGGQLVCGGAGRSGSNEAGGKQGCGEFLHGSLGSGQRVRL